jgi:cell division protein FtsQ
MNTSFTNEELRDRRRQLRKERQIRTLKVSWQVLLLGGIVGGVIWGVTRPDWTISKPQQVSIVGNTALTESAVRNMLGLRYPASLLQIEPQALNAKLLAQGSVVKATVHRELMPPRLYVQIRDRLPVAVVDRSINNKVTKGLLDETGQWLPLTSYRLKADEVPKLRLVGSQSCPGWSELYRAIQQSPVQISEVDCQDPLHLTLATEIGMVRIGEFDRTKIYKQLQRAHELRNWQQSTSLKNAIVDLENPQSPKLQEIGGKSAVPITSEAKPPAPVR